MTDAPRRMAEVGEGAWSVSVRRRLCKILVFAFARRGGVGLVGGFEERRGSERCRDGWMGWDEGGMG